MSEPQSIQPKRPLSPHLQIYKLPLMAKMSILHRMTGVALSFGTALVAWLLIAAASGEEAYNTFMLFALSPLGQLMLLGWSFALYYHLCNGIRHLFWDTGRLFKIRDARRAGAIVLFWAGILTFLTWCFATA